MRTKIIAALVGFMALVGCATTANYEAILNSWVGSSESALVASWGPPQSVYDAPDGTRILTYNTNRNVVIPGTAPTYTTHRVGNTYYTNQVGGSAPVNVGLNCQTNIVVSNGVISSWTWRGNDCTAF